MEATTASLERTMKMQEVGFRNADTSCHFLKWWPHCSVETQGLGTHLAESYRRPSRGNKRAEWGVCLIRPRDGKLRDRGRAIGGSLRLSSRSGQ